MEGKGGVNEVRTYRFTLIEVKIMLNWGVGMGIRMMNITQQPTTPSEFADGKHMKACAWLLQGWGLYWLRYPPLSK